MLSQLSKNNKRILLATMLIFLLFLPFFAGYFGNAWIRILAFSLLYIMLALGLNIVVGYAGLLDLGYVAFYAVGAYFYALLTSPHLHDQFTFISQLFPIGFGLNTIIIVIMAAFVAAFFGIMLGFPILKLRGDYLAIVTLGFGEIIRIFLNNLNSPINLTNGPQGIGGIEPLTIIGNDLSNSITIGFINIPSVQLHYYLFFLFALLIVIVSFRLENSRIGRAWLAIREDEIAAKSMGINTRNMKLLAFALGASFGGISGAMFAAFQGFVSPESFVLMESIIIVAMVVLGGLGNVYGVIIGAVLLYAIPEILRLTARPIQDAIFGFELIAPEALRMLLFGTSMVLIMLYRPQGIFPRASKHNG